jgi:uncharacterized protein YkwD
MSRLIQLFVLVAFLAPASTQAAYSTSTLLQATNHARTSNHLAPLTSNLKLQKAAENFAMNQAKTGQWSHLGYVKILNQTGYVYTYARQNLAKDFTDTSSTLQAWLDSPPHRANLLSTNFTETGIGMASSKGVIYVVQYFGKPYTR